MTSVAVELLVLVLAGVCLYQAKPARPFSRVIYPDYLSAESGRNVRGVLSVVIVLHHLAPKVNGILLLPLLSKMGYLTVSVFFFLSGYGLMKQYMQRENYARQFLLRRLPTILIPYALANFFYWLLSQFVGTPLTLRDIYNELRWGTPVVTASWYIICIALFYVGFRILMLLCGKRYALMLPGSIACCALYVLFCRNAGYNSWWYNTAPVLVVGVFWAFYEERLDRFFRKHYRTAAPVILVLFVGIYGIKILLNSRVNSDWVSIPLTWLVASLFTVCVLLLLMKVKLGNPVLQWLGDISLETYLCHFLFFTLLRSERIWIENDFLYGLLCLTCALLFAHVWHWLNQKLLHAYKDFLAKLVPVRTP